MITNLHFLNVIITYDWYTITCDCLFSFSVMEGTYLSSPSSHSSRPEKTHGDNNINHNAITFQVKYKLDELLLNEIDEDGVGSSDLFTMDTVKQDCLTNHMSVNCRECAITALSYNDTGTFLATGCRRGLVYVNSFEVRY